MNGITHPPDAACAIAYCNDVPTCLAYQTAARAVIHEFVTAEGRPPHVLVWGDMSAPLAFVALDCGAAHVTVTDARPGVCRAVSEFFRSQHPALAARCDVLQRVPIALGLEHAFDIIIAHAFGPTMETQGLHAVVWDLSRRRVLRGFRQPSGRFVHYTVPSSGTLTARLYHAGAMATVATRAEWPGVISIGAEDVASELRFAPLRDQCPHAMLDRLKPMSERVVLVHSHYNVPSVHGANVRDRVLLEPHAALAATTRVDECFIVLEWQVVLHEPTNTVTGNLLGMLQQHPAAEQVRMMHWPLLASRLNTTRVQPMHLAVTFSLPRGDVQLALCASASLEKPLTQTSEKKMSHALERVYASFISKQPA